MSQTESLDRAISTPTTSRSWWWFAAAALVVGHWPVAAAEALLGDLDQVDDLAAIHESVGRVVAGGVLHLVGGLVVAATAVGVLQLVRRRGAALARAGAVLAVVCAVAAGGMAMFHLLLVELAHPDLDRAAMTEFAELRLNEGAGWWALPVVLVLVTLPLSSGLLLGALVRARLVGWWVLGLFVGALVVYTAVPGEPGEIGGHVLTAVAFTAAGVSVARARSRG
ncbi:MAG TPA: hypothetical protein VFD41_02160 [Actinomycetales bacterium]|nr:hypothetical protein [Actinomycetales bacterium]